MHTDIMSHHERNNFNIQMNKETNGLKADKKTGKGHKYRQMKRQADKERWTE